jgi:SAM-dependent methyltransferase
VFDAHWLYHLWDRHTRSDVIKHYEPVLSFSDEEAARFHDERGDELVAVAFLKTLAGEGPALELAIGTGRIALPLAAQGIRVDGIDISPRMVERLRAKPGGEQLSVRIADFADVSVTEKYSLIYVVWNSLFNLLTQEDQMRCFENVAAQLTEHGSFVVEAFVPSFLHRTRDSQQVDAESIEVDEVRIGVLRHDAASQMIEQSHVTLSPAGIRLSPVVQRYAWPSELDLMARIAGLQRRDRGGGWSHEPLESGSDLHVSVYGR